MLPIAVSIRCIRTLLTVPRVNKDTGAESEREVKRVPPGSVRMNTLGVWGGRSVEGVQEQAGFGTGHALACRQGGARGEASGLHTHIQHSLRFSFSLCLRVSSGWETEQDTQLRQQKLSAVSEHGQCRML